MTFAETLHWLQAHRSKKTVVLVTGVFDLLHEEHLHFLQRAKELGDILVVGIESDSRVKQLKGENRPIWDQQRRMAEIEATKIAEAVFILPEQFSQPADHEKLISDLHPDFLAISSHTAHQEAKQKIIEKYGGKLSVVLEQNPLVSTSALLNNPKKS
ncbi:MAG: adenylyltransferase/cytidyltransferase family protein [Patescibacteria group bacterium]